VVAVVVCEWVVLGGVGCVCVVAGVWGWWCVGGGGGGCGWDGGGVGGGGGGGDSTHHPPPTPLFMVCMCEIYSTTLPVDIALFYTLQL